jgi:hypothetical protein
VRGLLRVHHSNCFGDGRKRPSPHCARKAATRSLDPVLPIRSAQSYGLRGAAKSVQ